MSSLDQAMRALMVSHGEPAQGSINESARTFVELITFADSEDILAALRAVLAEDWMALPVWARNLAYRLACLQRPGDAALLREAANDLLCFGPDWDNVAAELQSRAAKME
ncbi:hypothetical protein [Actinokineospora fastidiosa]|uniref:Uncharacterized protein n=1 Tax=Actinokineospora fastidiosa TaxID=1816 RepID=A0A918GR53_9PSEU|nr:hypothetical protein [Actinokineospora fastidiosa]GGS54623.1 hypothetical protein GCM10010171_57220 [Actinokineospora fastidiosa]